MNTVQLFGIQFLWFVVAWGVIARFFVLPMTENLETNEKLSVWLAPQLFRVFGLGLLVENLAPSLPVSFALPTAIGDSLTAVLALVSIVALKQNWGSARTLAWVCTIAGSLDLAIALPHAVMSGAALYLTGQWYVPAFIVPLMIVSHFMTFHTLLRSRS